MYEGSGPADEDEEDTASEPERESALSRADRDSIASRQGKARAGLEGAAPEEREADEWKRRAERDCVVAVDEGDGDE